MMRTLRWGLLLGLFGCELVVDFDRSRIPEAGVDSGNVDAGTLDSGTMDAGDDEDSGTDEDAGAEDAGPEDAAMDDAGDAAMDDAGTDAGFDAGPPIECTMPSECDDSVACTTDACTDDVCVFTPDDGMCDDDDDCTADACDAVTGCENDPICGVTTPATLVLADLTTVLVIPSVEAASAGHVVIYTNDAGAPSSTAIGSADVAAGTTANVTVELTRPAVDGETLHARLHLDDGDGNFEGAATDVPATLDGMPVLDSFVVDVTAGTPDLELRITGTNGTMDYVFGAGRPTTFASDLPTGNDPAITLLRGFRYRVVNAAAGDHPFELVTEGAPEDTRQLSQAIAGDLEGNANIAWVESGNDVLFTVHVDLEVVDRYRCSVHTSEMRGNVAYAD
jgi:hypothetical protein